MPNFIVSPRAPEYRVAHGLRLRPRVQRASHWQKSLPSATMTGRVRNLRAIMRAGELVRNELS
jgi:hypothetical protein